MWSDSPGRRGMSRAKSTCAIQPKCYECYIRCKVRPNVRYLCFLLGYGQTQHLYESQNKKRDSNEIVVVIDLSRFKSIKTHLKIYTNMKTKYHLSKKKKMYCTITVKSQINKYNLIRNRKKFRLKS